jgi:hypothetical protein
MFNKSAFVGKWNFDVIKMHGTTIKKAEVCFTGANFDSEEVTFLSPVFHFFADNCICKNAYHFLFYKSSQSNRNFHAAR